MFAEFLFGFGIWVEWWKFLKKVVDGAGKFKCEFTAVAYRAESSSFDFSKKSPVGDIAANADLIASLFIRCVPFSEPRISTDLSDFAVLNPLNPPYQGDF